MMVERLRKSLFGQLKLLGKSKQDSTRRGSRLDGNRYILAGSLSSRVKDKIPRLSFTLVQGACVLARSNPMSNVTIPSIRSTQFVSTAFSCRRQRFR
ncbi:hypothetical protein Mal52_30690 [Symmachiella dynata]|uniref:Uncharacterized protein n=1 Tax=Symmachiella dynata TaxID=2527995 RepID=A0A517ZQ30_9PLAN|nr:hypothetical protein Mal52_30690 [Symmachiella dynata]